jgi:hypothetical protein
VRERVGRYGVPGKERGGLKNPSPALGFDELALSP